MRTSGSPSLSTVASATALGSLGSVLVASASHSSNSANGSDFSVKSPLVLVSSFQIMRLFSGFQKVSKLGFHGLSSPCQLPSFVTFSIACTASRT